jgi:hypothetical protein
LHDFTLRFFTTFASPPMSLGNHALAPLRVPLSVELAEYFGKPELLLAFHMADLAEGGELVAYGSRIFDRMLSYVERRSAMTLLRLPNHHPSSDEMLRALQPVNAAISHLRLHEQTRHLFVFTWRITYRADDKREELYTIAVDQQGMRIPLAEAPALHALSFSSISHEGEPVPPEYDEAGLLLPPRLLPLTQLTQLAEKARKHAIYYADVRCLSHEAEILPRLYKSLVRLTTYYQTQIEEINDGHDSEGDRRRELEADLKRKIAEEIENHRLRVQVELSSYIALLVPTAVGDMTLSDGGRKAQIRIERDCYTGAIKRPSCTACGKALERVVLDRDGRLSCEACIEQCESCLQLVSGKGSTCACPACAKHNCATCSHECAACGEHACAGCIDRCPTCGDNVCFHCQDKCSHCGQRQCRSHLRLDAVPGADGVLGLICASCAVRCPNCKQYSAVFETCCVSGQRYCRNCTVVCTSCQRPIGPSFVRFLSTSKTSKTSKTPYCPECAERQGQA